MRRNDQRSLSAELYRGEVAIQRMAELKEELNSALLRADQVMIRLTETSLVDDARLKLLGSAQRHAAWISQMMGELDHFLCSKTTQRPEASPR